MRHPGRRHRSLPPDAENAFYVVYRLLPVAVQRWSLTSLQQRLFKTGGRRQTARRQYERWPRIEITP